MDGFEKRMSMDGFEKTYKEVDEKLYMVRIFEVIYNRVYEPSGANTSLLIEAVKNIEDPMASAKHILDYQRASDCAQMEIDEKIATILAMYEIYLMTFSQQISHCDTGEMIERGERDDEDKFTRTLVEVLKLIDEPEQAVKMILDA